MMTDPIGDMLARIKNACVREFLHVDVPASKIKIGILNVLEKEGYINGFSKVKINNREMLRVALRYYDNKPVIKILSRISKPSRRVYSKIRKLASAYNGFGVCVLSTSSGIMSDAEARRLGVGGEVLCKVF